MHLKLAVDDCTMKHNTRRKCVAIDANKKKAGRDRRTRDSPSFLNKTDSILLKNNIEVGDITFGHTVGVPTHAT
jgi:hypothetical protein